MKMLNFKSRVKKERNESEVTDIDGGDADAFMVVMKAPL